MLENVCRNIVMSWYSIGGKFDVRTPGKNYMDKNLYNVRLSNCSRIWQERKWPTHDVNFNSAFDGVLRKKKI